MSEPRIDTAIVKQLIATQFPQWADLEVRPVQTSGWDNRTYHLGDTMSVRLPSASRYAAQVEKEHRWLPKLAPDLPLAIPRPLAMGAPDASYPFHWSVMTWLSGETLAALPPAKMRTIAQNLAGFLNALRLIPTDDGPMPGAHNFYRGGDLRIYDQEVRHCLNQLANRLDAGAVLSIWTRACQSNWVGQPVWLHGDVAAGNLLVKDGKLCGVIDFGSCGIGDPACDLTIAWTVFQGDAREIFKNTIGLDRQTWARAAGWGLWKALLEMCKGTRGAEQTVQDILAEHRNFKTA